MNYYYSDSTAGEVIGPLSGSQLQALYHAGTIKHTTQVCEEGRQEWMPISSVIKPPTTAPAPPPLPATRKRYEHSVLVLHLEKKVLAMTRKDVLQGLSTDSASQLCDLGNQGWELVGVLPFTTGGVGLFSNASTGTDAALAFFKRVVY